MAEKRRIPVKKLYPQIEDKLKRITEVYYRYYINDGSDKWFIEPLESNRISTCEDLVFSVHNYLLRNSDTDVATGKIRAKIFSNVMRRMQHEMIFNRAFIPMPFGMGEITVGTSLRQGIYMKRRGKDSKDGMTFYKAKRYAKNTRGQFFRYYWHKAKVKHSHARYYKFEPVLGNIEVNEETNELIYYGTQGLAARILECNNNPNMKDYTANYI